MKHNNLFPLFIFRSSFGERKLKISRSGNKVFRPTSNSQLQDDERWKTKRMRRRTVQSGVGQPDTMLIMANGGSIIAAEEIVGSDAGCNFFHQPFSHYYLLKLPQNITNDKFQNCPTNNLVFNVKRAHASTSALFEKSTSCSRVNNNNSSGRKVIVKCLRPVSSRRTK